MSEESECPVCNITLPSGPKSRESNQGHINACIEQRFNKSLSLNSKTADHSAQGTVECPICHHSFSSKELERTRGGVNAHVEECLQNAESNEPSAPLRPPAYAGMGLPNKSSKLPEKGHEKAKESSPVDTYNDVADLPSYAANAAAASSNDRRPSLFSRLSSKLGREIPNPEEKTQATMARGDALMTARWGPPNSTAFEMVMRYWAATRMTAHWDYLRAYHPKRFERHMRMGYMEPIPTQWVSDRRLAYPYPEFSTYENAAEERLYYFLNHGILPDGTPPLKIRPLNINRDMNQIVRRGNERNARQVPLSETLLAKYASPADVFRSDTQTKSNYYSAQVPNTSTLYAARQAALAEFRDGILHGTDHLETMLLLDVSTSMTWNPHAGLVGPDGIRRYHDQPPNIALVEHLVHRVLHHMVPRAQREHPNQRGIDTVTFSAAGSYVGQLTPATFHHDWNTRIRPQLGGGTQVMQGWQAVKQAYFTAQHKHYGHGRWDAVFGWQATPGMPKLSLLVLLDGEATDMDEFELELLGETWAYVTIALVGMEGCPHHHSHAVELERVAKCNPHVGFFDVHGRVCERVVVEQLLGSVYPVDPPGYEEVCSEKFEIEGAEGLPAY